ncbi:methyltransferase [Spirosoma aureum]|uniref:tRNA1(Val) (adenine(37)-N6)-methyltransferase n=1 Tax=Spirosoma aureum TaxID=2692134 RepID=A0A6G9AZS9_9BACT|nr:methyltransferase [Spirosoma aureum]QIP17930.1 methyltransferase [Spirosoma aureum]
MKVCTDACVLGAYADVAGARILDIGTGTGLLALMTAQRNPNSLIDAVEIDADAFGQAAENIAASPFAKQVITIHERIQDFMASGRKYDRILTNPPFYTNHLRSPDSTVNRALHTDELPFSELIEAVVRLLEPEGQWWVLLPPYETGKLAKLASEAELSPFRQLALRHHAKKPVFRMVTGFSFQADNRSDEVLDIYEPDGRTYSTAFRNLLRDFYLIF